MRSRLAAGALLVALLGIAGCGGEPRELDPLATEAAVGGAVAEALQLAVVGASCPDGLREDDAEPFACEVELADEAGVLPVEVTLRGEGAELSVEPLAAVLSDEEVADRLRDLLTDEFDRSFLVDCGDEGPSVRLEGTRFNCRARDEGGPRSVRATVTDERGSLSFDLGR